MTAPGEADEWIDRMVREAVERTAFELDAKAEAMLHAAGWRKMPSAAAVERVIRDGMEDWREMSTTQFARGMTDAILALMDGDNE